MTRPSKDRAIFLLSVSLPAGMNGEECGKEIERSISFGKPMVDYIGMCVSEESIQEGMRTERRYSHAH